MGKSKSSKSSKSGKKATIDTAKQDNIKEKIYVTKEVETSITLLESPEHAIVLEALLFLSKYAEVQHNNVIFIQLHGILPRLLALLHHNICIVRVTLRLLAQLLTTVQANVEINEPKHDDEVLTIAKKYVETDLASKEFAIIVLAKFARLGRGELLLQEPLLIKTLLMSIKSPDNEVVLFRALELFSKLVEVEAFRLAIAVEPNFTLPVFVDHMYESEACFETIVAIFEKLTFFGEDIMQERLKECALVEHMFVLIIDPKYQKYLQKCLNIVAHSMESDRTNTYFIESITFLQFCEWAKTCSDSALPSTIYIIQELAKVDSIRQILYDLSVEDTIISFLRAADKKLIVMAIEAISHMSKHKFCCEKMTAPLVIRTILQLLNTDEIPEDPKNESALAALHYFARRDTKTLHMLCEMDGIETVVTYLKKQDLDTISTQRLLEIVIMILINFQLQKHILVPEMYVAAFDHLHHISEEIVIRSLEILINCLSHQSFRNYLLECHEYKHLLTMLQASNQDKVIRSLIIFLHNAMAYPQISEQLVRGRMLPILKSLPECLKIQFPLIDRLIKLVYDTYLPLKFFETGRLELIDRIPNRFYVIQGKWKAKFPFLEVLQMQSSSTRNIIYVVQFEKTVDVYPEDGSSESLSFGTESSSSVFSVSVMELDQSINYGYLSEDPYMEKYVIDVKKLLKNVHDLKTRVRILAEFVDRNLCGPDEHATIPDKAHHFKLHIECIREKLGTNMIPIGFLRIGFQLERALLFKALADQVSVPASFVRGKDGKLFWNEVGLIENEHIFGKGGKRERTVLRMYVVDLMNRVGQLMQAGSRDCNAYCDIQ